MDQVNFWSRIRICPPGQELLPTVLPFVKRRKEARVREPQSNALFFLLIVIFIALAWWMVATKHLLFRLLAGCLAFLPAMTFGVMAVNKYYGYYPTWSAAWADITNQGVNAPSRLPQTTLAAGRRRAGSQDQGSATLNGVQQSGYTLRLSVTGPRSHITRVVYVYLPPQYFQAAYSRYRFPAHRPPAGPAGGATGLDQRGRRDRHPRRADGQEAGAARRAGHARRERRPADLPAVPQPGARPAGPDLPGPGSAGQDRSPVPGPAAGPGVGRRRVLRGRVLCREHGPAPPRPVRVRRGAQRLLPASRQPAGAPGPAGQPVRARSRAPGAEHPAHGPTQAPRGRAHPAVLAGRGLRQRPGRGGRRALLARARAPAAGRAADPDPGRRPRHDHLAGGDPADAPVDDPAAGAGRPAGGRAVGEAGASRAGTRRQTTCL